jgi:hypothetical protein
MTIQITPDIWGPKLWKSIHFIALAYPVNPTDDQKKNYKLFFESLSNVIPCSICANNYKDHLKELPLNEAVLKDRETLVKWTIDVHNLVNKETNKEILSHDKAIELIIRDFKEPENDIKKENDKNLVSIQDNEISPNKNKNKNIDFEGPIPMKKNKKNYVDYLPMKNKKHINIEKEAKSSIFLSFTFWFIVFAVLVSIALLYKKNN